jgi:hypothetical protein
MAAKASEYADLWCLRWQTTHLAGCRHGYKIHGLGMGTIAVVHMV